MSSQKYRGSRCGECYWALYDGDWCQNPACGLHGKSVGDNQVRLSNREALILIAASERTGAADTVPVTDRCAHYGRRFVPSASGNESWYECADCGIELKSP